MTQVDERIEASTWDRASLIRQVFEQHAAALELYARQWCDCPEDVVQEAMIKLLRQQQPPDSVPNWLYRVVRNTAISTSRSSQRRRRYEQAASSQKSAWFNCDNGQELEAQWATDSLRDLPIEQREAIVLHLWGGMAFDAVGRLMGVSSSTAHRRYLAGISELRKGTD